MPVEDPVMAVADVLPLTPAPRAERDTRPHDENRAPLFGLRFAVTPPAPRADRHKKTYYTVTVKEATTITNDGKKEVIQDDVQRERED